MLSTGIAWHPRLQCRRNLINIIRIRVNQDESAVLQILQGVLTCPLKTDPHVKLERWIEGDRKMGKKHYGPQVEVRL